jgi:hypothetical protein
MGRWGRSRTHRIPIRDDGQGPVPVPVEITPPAATGAPTAAALPLCLTFRFRSRLIVCRPVWTDAGLIVALSFPCPRCCTALGIAARQEAPIDLSPEGALSVNRNIRCAPDGCGLVFGVVEGQAFERADLS